MRFDSQPLAGSGRYKEGPLLGRVTLYLFDHPEGASMEELENALLEEPACNALLKKAIRELIVADAVDVVWLPYGGGRTGRATGKVVGNRLTTRSWLKLARDMQDVGCTTEKPEPR